MASAVLGFILGPGFSAVTSLPSLAWGFTINGYPINFNQDTYPGYVSALFALFALPCMIPFKSIRPPKRDDSKKEPGFMEYFDKRKGGANLVGVLIIYASVFLFTIAFTIFETSGPIYVAADPYIQFTVFYTSLMFGALALVALLSIVFLRLVMRFFKNDRINLVIFGSLVSVGLFIIFCWEDPLQGWVSMARFLVGVFFVAFGFTVNQSLTTVVFSKILDGLEQGVMMGWMSSVSSIARFVSPIAATYLWVLAPSPPPFIIFPILCIFFQLLPSLALICLTLTHSSKGYVGHNWVILTAAVSTFISNILIAAFYRSLRPREVGTGIINSISTA
jgi:hypothetical protein